LPSHDPPTRRFIAIAVGTGCANTGDTNGMFGGAPPKPKTVLVADFVASPEVGSERPRLQHADGPQGRQFPILERKRRTLGRVNDEIMATIIATRREAGLDALPKARAGSRCRKSNSAARADEAAKT
jgi:hypothetical protein